MFFIMANRHAQLSIIGGKIKENKNMGVLPSEFFENLQLKGGGGGQDPSEPAKAPHDHDSIHGFL